jgi:hypothetical protein
MSDEYVGFVFQSKNIKTLMEKDDNDSMIMFLRKILEK